MNQQRRVETPALAPWEDFPILSQRIDGNRLVYLDSAATSLKPRSVIEATIDYYAKVGASVHRAQHMMAEQASTAYEAVRSRLADAMGVASAEIVFVSNTTHGLNLIAQGLDLAADALVLAPLDTHHSNLLPWRAQCRVELIRLDARGDVDLDHYRSLLARRPSVVALTHCSNVTGIFAPVRTMADLAHEHDAIVVLDAAQSAPHRRLRPAELGADFITFSAHKMLGPTGLGVLYGGRALLERLSPAALGGGTVDWVGTERHVLRDLPHRLEAGTPNVAGVYAFGAALTYLQRLGWARLEEHDVAMGELILRRVAAREHLSALGGDRGCPRSGIVSLRFADGRDPTELARILSDAHGVMCRSGHLCAQPLVDALAGGPVLRLSAYLYNSEQDIDAAFAALDAACHHPSCV